MNKSTVQNYITSSVITEHTVREKETTVKLNVKFSTQLSIVSTVLYVFGCQK